MTKTWAAPKDNAEAAARPLNVLVVDNAVGGTGGVNASFIRIKDYGEKSFKVSQIDWDSTDKGWYRPGAGNGSPTLQPILQANRPDVVILSQPDLLIPRDGSPDTTDPMMGAIIAASRLQPPPHIIIQEWNPQGLSEAASTQALEANLAQLRAAGVTFEVLNSPNPSDVYAALEKLAADRGAGAAAAASFYPA